MMPLIVPPNLIPDGWEYYDENEDTTFYRDSRRNEFDVIVHRKRMNQYSVALEAREGHGILGAQTEVVSAEDVPFHVTVAVAIGFMNAPGYYEQAYLENNPE